MNPVLDSVSTLTYNRQEASQYQKNADIQQKRARENVDQYPFQGDERVLDVGCGNGSISRYIAQEKVLRGSVTGIDIDLQSVQFAQEQYGASLTNLSFECHNACELPYVQQFDVVVSFACLSWIEKSLHEKVLRQMHQSLKPSGRLFIRLAGEGERPFHKALQQTCEQTQWKPYFVGYQPTWAFQSKIELEKILDKLNFYQIQIEDATKTVTFDNVQHLATWLKTWVPHRHELPSRLQDDFLWEAAKNYYAVMNLALQNPISMTMPALLVQAQK